MTASPGAPLTGGRGGTEDTFLLDTNEWMTEVRGRSGSQLDQVQFFTNLGRVSPVYGGNGGNPFSESLNNSVIKGILWPLRLTGRSAWYVL